MNKTQGDEKLNLHVVKASAGSGKTFMLALRYIEQLLFYTNAQGQLELRQVCDYHQHIMAITFTNKATNEMKSRIVKQLYILSRNPQDSPYYVDFKKRMVPGDHSKLQQAAQRALNALLFDYSEFNVCTNDKFFQSILRGFARELDRDYNFELQIDSDYALKVAVHNFLLSLGKDAVRTKGKATPVENWVKTYLRTKSKNNKAWNTLFNDNSSELIKVAKYITDESFSVHMPQLRAYLTGDNGETDLRKIDAFQQQLKLASEKCMSIKWSQKLHDILIQDGLNESALNGAKTVAKSILTDSRNKPTDALVTLATNGCGIDQFKKQYSPSSGTLDAITALARNMVNKYYQAQVLDDIAANLFMVGLIAEIDKKLEEYRHESNIILISDTNELIGKVVDNSGGAPFIYERTGTWINHYMLDEFQDTSRQQYNNFKPLIDESLSHSDDNFNLIIGDTKQAIYRFRNADPSLFRDVLNKDYSGAHTLTLEHNWRSQKNVVDFNNDFFEHLLDRFHNYKTLLKTYMPTAKKEDYAQLTPRNHVTPGGMVRVISKMFKKQEDNTYVYEPLSSVDHIAAFMPQYLLLLHERFSWKDINVLVNVNDEGRVMVDAILEHNAMARAQGCLEDVIPVVSAEMMSLGKSVAVRRIVALLRFIDLTTFVNIDEDNNEPDDEFLTSIKSRSNKQRLSAQRQFAVLGRFVDKVKDGKNLTGTEVGEMLKEAFRDVASGDSPESQMAEYASVLRELLPDSRTQTMSLVNIVEHLISRHISDGEGTDETIYLHCFQNCVMQFASQRGGGTVREFLRYWDQKGSSISVPAAGEVQAVNVLTIHKAKGLEADCVVLPFVNWHLEKDKSTSERYWVDAAHWMEEGGRALMTEMCNDFDETIVAPVFSVGKARLRKAKDLCDNFIHEIDEDVLVDNVNKTYVAFTRPRKELHIMTLPETEIGMTITSIMPLMGSFRELTFDEIDLMPDDALVMPDTTTGWWQMGEPFHEEIAEDNAPDSYEEKWVSKSLPPYAVSRSRLKVSLPHDMDSMREVGKRLHALLSRINYKRDWEQVIKYCLRRGIVSRNSSDEWNYDKVCHMINHMFTTSPMSEWFAQDNVVLNERSVITHDAHGDFVLKRPDRIIRRPDGSVIVVDYKFGQRKDKAHAAQVRAYMNALRDAGETQVQGYVYYVTTTQLLTI